MKQYKHFLVLLFTLCSIIAFDIPVHANISIVNPTETGSISILSLAVEDTGAFTEAGTGVYEENVNGEPIAGISYTVTRVQDDATTPGDAKPLEDENRYTATETTNGDGLAEFPELAQGVYLVQQGNSAAVQMTIEDFLVSVPMTDAAGTGWIYDVYVYPKYQLIGVPALNAYITETGSHSDSVGLLDTARWIAASEIPADIGAAALYEIQFTLDDALIYNGGVSVYTEVDTIRTTLNGETDYTAEVIDNVVTVTLQKEGQTTLAGLLPGNGTILLYTEIPTTLDIPTDALEATLGAQIPVQTNLRYTSSLNREHNIVPDNATPYVYTGGFSMIAYQNSSDTALAGASFKLYRTLEEAQAGTNPVPAPGNDIDWIATTGPEGTAAFYGLAYGGLDIANDIGTTDYFLVQTQAPANYNLLREPVAVTVNGASHQAANQVEIRSRSGFLLPATGGIGTFWFTIAGLAIIGVALYYYFRSRKRSEDHR